MFGCPNLDGFGRFFLIKNMEHCWPTKGRDKFEVHQQYEFIDRTISKSEKEFIENQRKLGKKCQNIAESLGIKLRLVYKWTALLKKR